MDNASINNALMKYIAENLGDEKIAYDSRQHKLRFNGQIIYLDVCAFLFEKHPYT